MKDQNKTKKQLINELTELRQRIAELEKSEAERKRIEDALRESEERYRTLFDHMPIGLYRTTPMGQIIDANPALVQMLGYPDLKSLLAINVTDTYLSPGDRIQWQTVIEREGVGQNFEKQLCCCDGTIIWVEENARVVRDLDGWVIYYEGSFQDITERKQAEEALHRSEQEMRLIADNVPALFSYVDADGCYRFVNNRYDEWFGLPKGEIIGKHYREVLGEATYKVIKERVETVLAGYRVHYEEGLPYVHGGTRWVSADYVPCIDENGKVNGFFALVTDITDRKRAEEALRESEEKYRNLVNNSNDIISTADESGNWTFLSPSVKRLLGYEPGEMVGRSAFDFMFPEDIASTRKAHESVVREGRSFWEYENRYVRKAGKVINLAWNVLPLLDKHGNNIGTQGVGRDITERRRTEEELRRSHEQLRSLSAHLQSIREEERTQIAREIHDELGQALTVLKMDSSWLANKIPKDEKLLTEKIESMSKLIDVTIQLVRRISTELRPGVLDDLGLIAAIEWQTQDFQNRTGIKSEFHPGMEDIELDRDRSTSIFRIFQETLTNVIRHANATRVNISLEEDAGNLVLGMKDNGRGITEIEISNPKSLGLLGMRERALLFGGEVKIGGKPGKGTRVMVTIPLNK